MGRKVYLGTNLINDSYVGLDKTNLPSIQPFFVDYVFAAGGGGGGASGGGGGGGEVQTNYYTGSQLQLTELQTYYIEIGDGGAHGDASTAGGQPNPGSGLNGGNTFISSSTGLVIINALGGGGGGGTYWEDPYRSTLITSEKNGKDGGNGGGGAIISSLGGSAIGSGYGLDGGSNSTKYAANATCSTITGSLTPPAVARDNSGGGGGAQLSTGYLINSYGNLDFSGSDGAIWFKCDEENPSVSDGQWPLGGTGGEPFIIPWVKTASSEVGAGGGGGETVTLRVGAVETDGRGGFGGGAGGGTGGKGGNGGQNAFGGGDGDANTGGGGGGGALSNIGTTSDYYKTTRGGDGGSGIAVIRYPEPQRYTGGDTTIEDGYVYHTFLSSSTLQPL